MKVRVYRAPGRSELLSTRFALPQNIKHEGGEAFAWRMHAHPRDPAVVLKFDECALVFDAETGELLWSPSLDGPARDIVFIRGGTEALVLYDYPDGRAEGQHRTRTGIRRFDWRRRAPLEELYFDRQGSRYPSDSLVVSPGERMVVASSSYCTELTYEVIALESPMRLLEGHGWPRPGYDGPGTVDPIAFSPSGTCLVTVDAAATWWANSEDEMYDGSSGGPASLVHDLTTNDISTHDVSLHVPEGFCPDEPEAACWSGLWAPRFTDEKTIELTLSDGQSVTLDLPLPGAIRLDVTIDPHGAPET